VVGPGHGDPETFQLCLQVVQVLRLPLHPRHRGEVVQVKAAGLAGIDDFAFTGAGEGL
jgi:hypothetical protein